MAAPPMLHSSKRVSTAYKAGLREEATMTVHQWFIILGFWASVLLATGLRFLLSA